MGSTVSVIQFKIKDEESDRKFKVQLELINNSIFKNIIKIHRNINFPIQTQNWISIFSIYSLIYIEKLKILKKYSAVIKNLKFLILINV